MILLVTVMALLAGACAQYDADVLILGAGSAGIAAAKVLADKNVSFLIIEAADYIGGRVKSSTFSGLKVELGTPALYGSNDTIYKWINGYNISGNFVNYESVIVRTSQNTQNDTEADMVWEKLATAQGTVGSIYQKIKSKKMSDLSIRASLQWGKWFPKTPLEHVIEIYDYDFEFAKVPELISTFGFEDINKIQQRPYWSTDPRGLQNMVERFAGKFLDRQKSLKLNETVSNVNYTGASVSVSTKSGKTFTGKYAIVTFSMGVLKSGSVSFNPALPDWKMDTIVRTSMDVYTQIYVKFPSKFWGSEEYILHANPRRGYYPVIINLEAAGFHPAGTNVLLVTVFEEEARRVERASKAVVMAEITAVFKAMYGSSTPAPQDILVTRWLQNPLTLGSFTSFQVGDINPAFIGRLRSKVGRVYFAGEAYAKTLDGFFQGAILSGEDTAKILYDCMMKKPCPEFNPNSAPPTKPPSTGASSNKALPFITLAALLALFVA